MVMTIEITERAFASLTGLNKSLVHRLLKKGDLNQLRTKGEPKVNQVLNATLLEISRLAPQNEPRVNQERTKSEPSKEKDQESDKDIPPITPIEINKEKEKENYSPFGLFLSEKVSPQGERETTKTQQCFTEQKKETEKTKSTTFYPPTIAEVQNYIDTKGYHVDAEHFCAFYESKGWFVGKNKMKNWRMAVVTWEKMHKQDVKQNSSYNYGTGNFRTNSWGNRRPAPVIASSAKDYEGRF